VKTQFVEECPLAMADAYKALTNDLVHKQGLPFFPANAFH
jgi:hypothetical protein